MPDIVAVEKYIHTLQPFLGAEPTSPIPFRVYFIDERFSATEKVPAIRMSCIFTERRRPLALNHNSNIPSWLVLLRGWVGLEEFPLLGFHFLSPHRVWSILVFKHWIAPRGPRRCPNPRTSSPGRATPFLRVFLMGRRQGRSPEKSPPLKDRYQTPPLSFPPSLPNFQHLVSFFSTRQNNYHVINSCL